MCARLGCHIDWLTEAANSGFVVLNLHLGSKKEQETPTHRETLKGQFVQNTFLDALEARIHAHMHTQDGVRVVGGWESVQYKYKTNKNRISVFL